MQEVSVISISVNPSCFASQLVVPLCVETMAHTECAVWAQLAT